LRIISNAAGRNTMPYTLAEAAAATGTNKSTILRAIKSGKISGAKDEHGAWLIEPAELHRVYPPAEERSEAQGEARSDTHRDPAPIAEAMMRAALAEERINDLRAMLDEMRTDRNAWRDQAQRLSLPASPASERHPWWRRLAG
jgi:excisionase family DNA binding protein